MRGRIILARLPVVILLAIAMTILLARSSLVALLPVAPSLPWVFGGILLLLVPSLVARETPLPAATLILVPILAVSAYGAGRLDWLRVLKDFGVAEAGAIDPPRLALGATTILLLWALHAVDLATRLRSRAIARGIDAAQAGAAARRTLLRNMQAAGIALAGAIGLLPVALLGLAAGARLPVERAALVAPLLAAAILAGAAIWIARGRSADE